MNVTIFGLHLKINPIAFTLPIGGGWDVYWYGIMIALGFLCALLYAMKNAPRFNLVFDKIVDIILVVVPVSVLCARLYYCIFDGEKLNGIGDFFGFNGSSGFSGLAIYGAVIGAAISVPVMCKIKKVKILDAFDIAAVGFFIGQAFGRWGNFFNQEAYGTFTGSSFWGMQSERTVYEMGEGLVHPCFLYESIWCLIGFFILNHFSKKRKYSGQIGLIYCAWYGFERALLELIRTDSLMLGNIRVSSLLSAILFVGAATALILINKKLNAENGEAYVSQFGDIAEAPTEEEVLKQQITEDMENGENN